MSSRVQLAVGVGLGLPLAAVGLLAAQAVYAATVLPRPDLDPVYSVVATVGEGDAEPLRLLALGDSTVAGVGAPTVEGSLPVQVAERVAATLDRPVHVRGVGVSGATTAEVTGAQLAKASGLDADVVLLVTGANDVTGLTPPWTLRGDTRDALAGLRDTVEAPIVLGGIPRFGPGLGLPEPLRWVASRYASVLRDRQRQAAAAAGIAYVDLAAEADPRFAGVPDAFAADDYHPSPVGYGFWADALAPAVVSALGR